jgi:hypothetical protein
MYWGLIWHSVKEKAKDNQLLDTGSLLTLPAAICRSVSLNEPTIRQLSNLIPDTMNTLKIHFNIIPPPSPRQLKRPLLPALRFPYTVRSPQIKTTELKTHNCDASPLVSALLLVHMGTKHFPRQLFLRHSQHMFLLCNHSWRFTLVQKNVQRSRLSTTLDVLNVGQTITHWRGNRKLYIIDNKLYIIDNKPAASVNKRW